MGVLGGSCCREMLEGAGRCGVAVALQAFHERLQYLSGKTQRVYLAMVICQQDGLLEHVDMVDALHINDVGTPQSEQ